MAQGMGHTRAVLHLRTATAFRRQPRLTLEAPDVLYTWQHEKVRIALIANAYEGGFSSCWPDGSNQLLNTFEFAWGRATGSVQTRLSSAFQATRESFDLLGDTEDEFGTPAGSLLAVACVAQSAFAVWIGCEVAFHTRAFEASRTTPHSVREHYRAKLNNADVSLDNLPINTLSRSIRRAKPDDPPSTATFQLKPGDSLVLLHHEHIAAEEVAYTAASFLSPQLVADSLADLALREGQAFSAVIVLRFDGFDFAREIDRLIASYVPPAQSPELDDWARKHQALPVMFDPGGFFAIKRDGSVLSDVHALGEPRCEETMHVHRLVAVAAARRFPSLAALAPKVAVAPPKPPRLK